MAGSHRSMVAFSIFVGACCAAGAAAAHAALVSAMHVSIAPMLVDFDMEPPSLTTRYGDAGGQGRCRRRSRVCLRDLERAAGAQVRGRRADPEIDSARFDEPLPAAPESELLGREAERQPLLLPGAELDALETAQLEHRPRHRGDRIAHVELHDLVRGDAAGVRDADRDVDALSGADLLHALRQGAVLELAVREPEAEWILRRDRQIVIPDGVLGQVRI